MGDGDSGTREDGERGNNLMAINEREREERESE
jgi:hypothetical protein